MRIYLAAAMFLFLLLAVSPSNAGENLKINPKLDYSSDSNDGPLITGDHMDVGAAQDRVNYVLMYGEGCYNSKRPPHSRAVREVSGPRQFCDH